jgi:hypothetical protein
MRSFWNSGLPSALPVPARSAPRRRRYRGWPALALIMTLAAAGVAAVPATAASARPMPPPFILPPAAGVAPGALTGGSTGVEVFYTAADGSVWVKEGLSSLPVPVTNGRLASAPAPIWAGGAEMVFGQGTDNHLWFSRVSNGTWTPWSDLGGNLTGKPGAVFRGPAPADYSVYVRGTDGAVWGRDHSAAVWSAWHRIGGQVLSGTGPAAVRTNAGPVLAVAGTDREVFLYGRTGTESGFTDLGGQTTSSPGVAFISAGTVAAFARGTDNAAWYRQSGLPIGPAGPWRSIGGRLTSGVAAVTEQGGSTYVFGLGTNNQVYGTSGLFPAFGGWNQLTG